MRAGFGPAIGPCLYLCIDIIGCGKPVSNSVSGCRVVHCCAYLGLYEVMGGGLLFYCMRLATGSFLVGRVLGFCGVVKVSSYGLDSGVCEVVYEISSRASRRPGRIPCLSVAFGIRVRPYPTLVGDRRENGCPRECPAEGASPVRRIRSRHSGEWREGVWVCLVLCAWFLVGETAGVSSEFRRYLPAEGPVGAGSG